MMMSNGDGGGGGDRDGAEKGNVNGGHYQEQEEEDDDDDDAFRRRFPTGYRFRPTDEELIKYYLYRKVNKFQLPPNLIKNVNLYAFNPWDLSDKYKSYGDNECYFFTPRERKYQNGKRPNRAANGGYWKASGGDKPIKDRNTNEEIGYKRLLSFYLGKPPKPDAKRAEILRENKTDWLMHEYTLQKLKGEEKGKSSCTDSGSSNHMQLDGFVLCKVYKKPGKSTKDIKCPGHDQCEDIAVDSASPSSIANSASSSAVPEHHFQMHQTVVDQQYLVASSVAMAATEDMVPENHHYMCQTDVPAGNHQYSLTSMVVDAAAQEEILPSNYSYGYLDNGNPLVDHYYNGEMNQQQYWQSAVLPYVDQHNNGEMMNQQQLQTAGLPSVDQHYHGEINQQQYLQSPTLPSVNHQYQSEMNQQQLQEEYMWNMLIGEINNIDSKPNFLSSAGCSSLPDFRTDIGPK